MLGLGAMSAIAMVSARKKKRALVLRFDLISTSARQTGTNIVSEWARCRLTLSTLTNDERARAIPCTLRALVPLAQKARHPRRALVCQPDGVPPHGPQVRRPPCVVHSRPGLPLTFFFVRKTEMEELPEVQWVRRARIGVSA